MPSIGKWCGKCPKCKKMTKYFIINFPNGKWWCRTCKTVFRKGESGAVGWEFLEKDFVRKEPVFVEVGKWEDDNAD